MGDFPRDLTEREKDWLFFVLPGNKPGYKKYRDKIENLFVIGEGRFGGGNLVLGEKGDEPDLGISSAPIFASGKIFCENAEINVTVHEEQDDKIEFDISNMKGENIPENISEIVKKTYSSWVPGEKSPLTEKEVREISFNESNYTIAVAEADNKIWLYEKKSGINYFIPVTNFFNEVMMIKNIRDPKVVLNPGKFFERLNEISDKDIIRGFLSYNNYLKRVDLPESVKEETRKKVKKKKFFSFLKRGN